MRAALLLLLPACDVVFGLEREHETVDAAAVDQAMPDRVTGRFTYRYVTNQADGVPAVSEERHPELSLLVFVGDALEATVLTLDDEGGFSFDRPPGARYRLQWISGVDDGVPTEWTTDVPSLVLASQGATRPGRTPVTLSTTLSFPMPTAAGERIVLSTGIWSETGIPGNVLDWQKARALSPPIGLLDQARADRLYYVLRQPQVDLMTGLSYTAIGAEASAQITMMDGVAQFVPLTFAAQPRDQCAKLVALRASLMARVAIAAGSDTAVVGDDWLIQAAPNAMLGPVGALTIAYNNEVTPTNATLTAMFRNPFPGHAPLAAISGFRRRAVTMPGTTAGHDVAIGVRTYVPVEPCPAMTVLDSTQGIPGPMLLADTSISSNDGAIVALVANQAPALSWKLAVDGRVDLTTVSIFEVAAQAGQTVLVPLRRYHTTDTTIVLDPTLLQAGRYYVVRLDSNVGHVNARTGDLRTVAYPYGNATQWSHVFGVALQ